MREIKGGISGENQSEQKVEIPKALLFCYHSKNNNILLAAVLEIVWAPEC